MIAPGYAVEDRLNDLVQLCIDGQIDEVMLLTTAEELTQGHPTEAELEPWIEVACAAKARLAEIGVELSINPWTTTFHVARGRRLKPGQDFNLMVGETGAVARITACPLCPNWQKYICDQFASFAKRIDPVAIWIEDDWRLHNHEPEMAYGGCFCPLHLQRFEAMVGERGLTREAVLEAILKPGQPHPWREKWIELWGQSLVEPAQRMRETVAAANPNTRLGLMSSHPDVHSIEGRPWHQLQSAIGDKPSFLTRPHLPPYTQVHALACPPSVTRATLANLRRPLTIYPELENSPRSGAYSKSKNYSAWECLTSAAYGSHGITINHYDMCGTGPALDPQFPFKLQAIKPRLSAVAELQLDDQSALGPAVLIQPTVATHLDTSLPTAAAEAGVNKLKNRSLAFCDTLAILGVAHGIATSVEELNGRTCLACDQTLTALDDVQLDKLLQGSVVLDAVAAATVVARQRSQGIGIAASKWIDREDTAFAYEQIDEDDPSVYGLAQPRMTAQRCATQLLAVEPAADAKVLSWILDAQGNRICPGAYAWTNEHGGTAIVLAYPLATHQFMMGFFNVYRRQMFERMLFDIRQDNAIACVQNHPMHVYYIQGDTGVFAAAMNPTEDPADELVMRMVGLPAGSEPMLLNEAGRWEPAPYTATSLADGSSVYRFKTQVQAFEGAFIHWPKA